MDYTGMGRLLDAIEREPRENRARALLGELRDHLGAPWVDEVLHVRARALCERYGFTCPARNLASLGIGETWLLLAMPGGRGHVVRLVAGGAGTHAGDAVQDEGRRAVHGLRAAAGRQKRRLPSQLPAPDLRIVGSASRLDISGGSLGLSTAIATLSRALGKAPPRHVAGSAVVRTDGTLGPVSFLPGKVQALRAAWPEVTTLVVSDRQNDTASLDGALRMVRASDLASACAAFDLPLTALPPCRLEDRKKMLENLRGEEHKAHVSADWHALSADAWEVAEALRGDASSASKATEAILLAAIFASHAGDGELGRAILANVSEVEVTSRPVLHVRKLVYLATGTIDDDVDAAERIAAEAVRLAETLSGDERVPLTGQALGTYGRVFLHGGRLEEAEPLLWRALEIHRRELEQEWPRSACYLAACLRLAGRSEESMMLATEALAATDRHAERWELAETTALYLHLERGRALAALGRLEDALRDLDRVVKGQDRPAAYPRLGAHRSLVEVLTRLGRLDDARSHLGDCIAIARGGFGQTLRRVGGVAAAEALVSSSPLLPAADLTAAWTATFGEGFNRAHVLKTWIY